MGESSECAWVTTKYIAKQQERLSTPALTGRLKVISSVWNRGELIQKLNRVRAPEELPDWTAESSEAAPETKSL